MVAGARAAWMAAPRGARGAPCWTLRQSGRQQQPPAGATAPARHGSAKGSPAVRGALRTD